MRPFLVPVFTLYSRLDHMRGSEKVNENEREITREDLSKLIWTKPITVLAKEFGISNTGLAKVCKRLNVPRPYRGYWRLLETGRKRSIPPLPPLKKTRHRRRSFHRIRNPLASTVQT
jgi:hypothetical protein